jgi:hypothetical protein
VIATVALAKYSLCAPELPCGVLIVRRGEFERKVQRCEGNCSLECVRGGEQHLFVAKALQVAIVGEQLFELFPFPCASCSTD